MTIAGIEANLIIVTSKNGRLISGFTHDDIILTEECLALVEKKVGDIRFIPLEDGSIQAIPFQEGTVFPVGTMNSEEFITRFKEIQKQKAAQSAQDTDNDNVTISSNDNSDDFSVDPLEDVEVEDIEVLED